MNQIHVTFVCGHHDVLTARDALAAPCCPACGMTAVHRTISPPPRFRGTCAGPYAETVALDQTTYPLTKTPLVLAAAEKD